MRTERVRFDVSVARLIMSARLTDDELAKSLLDYQKKTMELAFRLATGEMDAFNKVFNKESDE